MYYEDLQTDALAAAVRLATFLGMRLTKYDVRLAVAASSFEAMRQKEASGDLRLRTHMQSAKTLRKAGAQSGTPLNPNELFGVMTRKGIAGGWREEMDESAQAIVESAMRTHLDTRLLERYLPHATQFSRVP